MNKAKWDALPEDVQETFRASIKEFQQTQVNALKERDLAAIEAAKASGDVTIHDWPAEERAKFRGIARGEWEKVASQSEMAQKVYDSLNAYLESKGLIQ